MALYPNSLGKVKDFLRAGLFLAATILPSGDTTGVTDLANVQAALNAGVPIRWEGNYWINSWVNIPGGAKWYFGAGTCKLVAGSNCNMLRNTNAPRRPAPTPTFCSTARRVAGSGSTGSPPFRPARRSSGITIVSSSSQWTGWISAI